MPNVKTSTELKYNYEEISTFCHDCAEPVFITHNDKVNLVVMSIENYVKLVGNDELYRLIKEGLDDVEADEVMPLSDAIYQIRKNRIK
ncbi:prevent-host-death protein [Enterococcus cecorum]|uniref:type II toxin-antitoxin system Phd/YefM family antitoxin n=1 Tax=Enterococcus cecorum TaxID=44008 RepID=UPI0025A3AD8B|nr:prevent-host-death protein [Enterococcus cecorum]MDM8182634.1 prevent-host-death protein [Enterococcus cecorum]